MDLTTFIAQLILFYCLGFIVSYFTAQIALRWGLRNNHAGVIKHVDIYGLRYLATRLALFSWVFFLTLGASTLYLIAQVYIRRKRNKWKAYRIYRGMQRDVKTFTTPEGKAHMQRYADEAYERYKKL